MRVAYICYRLFRIVGFRGILSAIDKRFEFLDSQDGDECECALEALGQIGSCKLSSLCYVEFN